MREALFADRALKLPDLFEHGRNIRLLQLDRREPGLDVGVQEIKELLRFLLLRLHLTPPDNAGKPGHDLAPRVATTAQIIDERMLELLVRVKPPLIRYTRTIH